MSGNNYNTTNQNYGYDPNFSPVPPNSAQGGQYGNNSNPSYPNYNPDYNLNNQPNSQSSNQLNNQPNEYSPSGYYPQTDSQYQPSNFDQNQYYPPNNQAYSNYPNQNNPTNPGSYPSSSYNEQHNESPNLNLGQPETANYQDYNNQYNNQYSSQYPPAGNQGYSSQIGQTEYPQEYGNNQNMNTPGLQTAGYNSYSQPQDFNNPNSYENTFQEEKTGNSPLLSFIVIIIIILLGVSAFLVFINFPDLFNTATNFFNTQKASADYKTEEEENLNSSETGGENTPATLARENDSMKLSRNWIRTKFPSSVTDEDGHCLVIKDCGPGSDPDNDNLTNLYESQFNTDPITCDTDNDGICDGDEVFIYYTNPKDYDSNKNGSTDLQDIANCTDPTTSPNQLFAEDRLKEISSKISLQPLSSKTQKELEKNGFDIQNIQINGYIPEKCTPDSKADQEAKTEETKNQEAKKKPEIEES